MKKVVLGMSGGVDSSTSAIILKKQGYEVIGITFKFIDNFDTKDVCEVAKKLNIEHHIVDYRKEFKTQVIDKFLNDYKSGITPNPCVICNKNVKLKFLYQQMIKYNADYIATGHYAKIEDGRLYKSVDLNKDQTYFLYEMTRDELNKLILPLEGINKDEVRKIAENAGLSVAQKKDSTDVCFISKKFSDYISDNIDNISGDIIDINTNKILGKHKGLSYYTIGQRKGLNIGGNTDKMFVVGKDINKNVLYVALNENNDYLYSDSCIINKVNFISDLRPNKCLAKFRYRQQDNDVELEYLDNNEVLIKYPNKIKSVTPGQSCVLYIDNECIGGGIIKEVRKNGKKLNYL